MEIGKVPENVLKRSVFKKLTVKRPEVLVHAGVGEDCAVLAPTENALVLSTDPITASAKEIGTIAFHITANDIASSGAELVGILLTIIMPPNSEEGELKQIMDDVSQLTAEYDVEILQVVENAADGRDLVISVTDPELLAEVSAVVNQTLVSVTGIGRIAKDKLVTTKGLKPGQDLVVTKWIGLEGTSIIATEFEKELKKRLPVSIVDESKKFASLLSVVKDSRVAMQVGVSAMHDVTEGGIFGALWEMAEASGVGLCVDLKKIPIRQETIEICEFFNLNPYQLISSGSMLIGTDHGSQLVDALAKEGIHAAVIGKAVEGNDRVIFNDGEKRFLEPPKADELYRAFD